MIIISYSRKWKWLFVPLLWIGIAKIADLDYLIWKQVKNLKYKLKNSNGYCIIYMGYTVDVVSISIDTYDVYFNKQRTINNVKLEVAKSYGLMLLHKHIKDELGS